MHLIPFNRGRSGTFNLNLAFNDGKVYIMDNHLAASWCWLQKIDPNTQYSLLHIDRHYDLLDSQTDFWVNALRSQNINLRTVSIQELVALRYRNEELPTNGPHQIFRWDNYLTIFNRLYPGVIGDWMFATHKDGSEVDEITLDEIEPWDLHTNLSYWINGGETRWIVNLDIDYFFSDVDNRYFQMFADEFVIRIANEIRTAWNKIDVLTIALSPEMCGGWENAERVAQLITSHLNIQWIE